MTIIYRDEDADLNALAGRTVGIVGYDDLGRALALNLRDSGVDVLVSPYEAPDEYSAAQDDGQAVASAGDLAERAEVILLTLADNLMTEHYTQLVSPRLRRGKTLLFCSGYNLANGYIDPPPFVDVGLVAPRAHGQTVRELYLQGTGAVSFVAVAQDASRSAWQTVLAVAGGAGLLRAGGVEVNFEQEPQLSLFVQQAIVPAFYRIMVAAANVLLSSGYAPEAVLTDLYLSGKFSDYLHQVRQGGLLNAILMESLTHQYATFSRLDRFNELQLERVMDQMLNEIRGSGFSKEWSQEQAAGLPRFLKLRKGQEDKELWDWEQQTLDLLDG